MTSQDYGNSYLWRYMQGADCKIPSEINVQKIIALPAFGSKAD
jgi:hypothetical protein